LSTASSPHLHADRLRGFCRAGCADADRSTHLPAMLDQ
jgi:hypothetical protein